MMTRREMRAVNHFSEKVLCVLLVHLRRRSTLITDYEDGVVVEYTDTNCRDNLLPVSLVVTTDHEGLTPYDNIILNSDYIHLSVEMCHQVGISN